MRRVSEALRGARAALAARPGVFWSVTAAVAALNVFLPVAVLSAARKPVDFFTFNPWLKRLPDYLASSVPIEPVNANSLRKRAYSSTTKLPSNSE